MYHKKNYSHTFVFIFVIYSFLRKFFYILDSCKTTISLGWAQSSSKKHHLSTMSTRVLKRKYLVLIWWFSLRTAVLQRYHGHLNKMFGSDFPFSCHMKLNRLFVCQDENENEPEDESFRSFWRKPVTNKPGFSTMIYWRIGSFVMHYLQNERKLWFSSSFSFSSWHMNRLQDPEIF